jgi:methylglutaconyl-CoA hydratase
MVLAGRGPAFCAGADLGWMKKMSGYTFAENHADALGLARMLHALYTMKKPTVARVHGPAFAGGMGLVAACDVAVAAHGAEFCLSEAKLGLIPATISPYVIAAMGARAAHRYMLTAERFPAAEAYRIGFVQELCVDADLDGTVDALLGHLVQGGPAAHAATKDLIRAVAGRAIDEDLIGDTATRIATARASDEGKEGIRSFLEKRKPAWAPAELAPRKSAKGREKR